PHMSAFGGKAEITFFGDPFSRVAIRGKADILFASRTSSRSQRDQPQGNAETKGLGGLNRSRIRRLCHKNRVGQRIVRHICAEGLLSRPRPSFGCLKFRPMMSTKSSRLTLAFGSNE